MTLTLFSMVLVSGFLIVVSFVVVIIGIDSLLNGHDLPTSRHLTQKIVALVKKNEAEKKVIYDLGSAHGTFSLRMKRLLPHATIYGIDNNAIRVFVAQAQNLLLGRNVRFIRQDIFQTDLSDADLVYTYLWYDLMPVLEEKLQKELKKGAVVITQTSHFNEWKPSEEIIMNADEPEFERLFIYIKN